MTEKVGSRRLRPVLDTQELARSARTAGHPGEDLVGILMKLTSDVERFDSMVVLQRKMLEERAAHSDALDDDGLARQSERLQLEAAEIVADARQALDQLRRLSEGSPRR